MSKSKDPVGRPPKFEERFCQMLIEHRAQGFSYESFSAVIGTCRKTLYNWEKEYPKFLHAKMRAKEASLRQFEHIGLALATGKIKSGNASVLIFMMKNQHADMYQEQPELSIDSIEDVVFNDE